MLHVPLFSLELYIKDGKHIRGSWPLLATLSTLQVLSLQFGPNQYALRRDSVTTGADRVARAEHRLRVHGRAHASARLPASAPGAPIAQLAVAARIHAVAGVGLLE